jgi:hypothetical protein
MNTVTTIILTSVLPVGMQACCGFHVLKQEELNTAWEF